MFVVLDKFSTWPLRIRKVTAKQLGSNLRLALQKLEYEEVRAALAFFNRHLGSADDDLSQEREER